MIIIFLLNGLRVEVSCTVSRHLVWKTNSKVVRLLVSQLVS